MGGFSDAQKWKRDTFLSLWSSLYNYMFKEDFMYMLITAASQMVHTRSPSHKYILQNWFVVRQLLQVCPYRREPLSGGDKSYDFDDQLIGTNLK